MIWSKKVWLITSRNDTDGGVENYNGFLTFH